METAIESAQPPREYHPLASANLFEDFKALLTRPRYFFEFFAEPSRFDRVVWAKVLLIYLALSALNSMVSFTDTTAWNFNLEGVDPRLQAYLHALVVSVGSILHQLMVAAMPFLGLLITAMMSVFCVFSLRLLGGGASRLSWSGIFCVFIVAQWTTIFGFIPGVGTILVALMPIVFSVVGLAQLARLSKLRTLFGAYVVTGILLGASLASLAGVIFFFVTMLF